MESCERDIPGRAYGAGAWIHNPSGDAVRTAVNSLSLSLSLSLSVPPSLPPSLPPSRHVPDRSASIRAELWGCAWYLLRAWHETERWCWSAEELCASFYARQRRGLETAVSNSTVKCGETSSDD